MQSGWWVVGSHDTRAMKIIFIIDISFRIWKIITFNNIHNNQQRKAVQWER